MIWNSPFQPLIPNTLPPAATDDQFTATETATDFSCTAQFDPQSALYLPPELSDIVVTNNFNTDFPVLDSLFSELNSDLNNNGRGKTMTGFNNENINAQSQNFNNNFIDFGVKSEPVNLEDIERILLPAQTTTRKSKH